MTHTYAILEISSGAYAEIKQKLSDAGYQHAFHDDVIDMHGIAVQAEAPAVVPAIDPLTFHGTVIPEEQWVPAVPMTLPTPPFSAYFKFFAAARRGNQQTVRAIELAPDAWEELYEWLSTTEEGPCTSDKDPRLHVLIGGVPIVCAEVSITAVPVNARPPTP